MERLKNKINMLTRRIPNLFEDWINEEIPDRLANQNDECVYLKGYNKFYEMNYMIVLYEIKDLESGLDPDIREINNSIIKKWKELSIIERLKYNLII